MPVPNRLYATDAKPPTCKVLPVRRYEAEAVPWTSKVVEGAVVPDIDYKRAAELEKQLKHDVMAYMKEYAEKVLYLYNTFGKSFLLM